LRKGKEEQENRSYFSGAIAWKKLKISVQKFLGKELYF